MLQLHWARPTGRVRLLSLHSVRMQSPVAPLKGCSTPIAAFCRLLPACSRCPAVAAANCHGLTGPMLRDRPSGPTLCVWRLRGCCCFAGAIWAAVHPAVSAACTHGASSACSVQRGTSHRSARLPARLCDSPPPSGFSHAPLPTAARAAARLHSRPAAGSLMLGHRRPPIQAGWAAQCPAQHPLPRARAC